MEKINAQEAKLLVTTVGADKNMEDVYYKIKCCASAGMKCVFYNSKLREEDIKELEGLGFKVSDSMMGEKITW